MRSRRARSTCQSFIPIRAASAPEGSRDPATRAIVRSFEAIAAMKNAKTPAGGTPSSTTSSVLGAIVAGSIFTFSLTLGDYITPTLVSPDTQFIGNVIFSQHTNNLPLASAFAVVPIIVMGIYLAIARRLGAFEHL